MGKHVEQFGEPIIFANNFLAKNYIILNTLQFSLFMINFLEHVAIVLRNREHS